MENMNGKVSLSQDSDLGISSDIEEFIMGELKSNTYPSQIMNLSPEYVDFDGVYTTPSLLPQEPHSTDLQTLKKEVLVANDASSPTGTLPCIEEYKGLLDFELFLDGSTSSKSSWVYSHVLHKVFLDINKVIMMQFKVNAPVKGLRVRALAVYNLDDKRSSPVNRCKVHSTDVDPHCLAHKDEGKCLCADYKWVGHVIQTSHADACYEYNPQSKRHSVTVPLEAVQPGCDTVIVPYHFTCKTSCTPGMNRQPINVIFTLETPAGEVIGRQSVLVKICSCPKRDKCREENDNRVTREDAKRLGIELPTGKRRKSDSDNHHSNHEKKSKITSQNTTLPQSCKHDELIKEVNELGNTVISCSAKILESFEKMTELIKKHVSDV